MTLAASGVSAWAGNGSPAPLIAAAASLRFALGEVAEHFERESGSRVRLTVGSSGNLSRQIRQGAPYEVFLAADPRYVEDLVRLGLTEGAGRDVALGRLALVVPVGSALAPDGTLADLAASLREGRLRRFAIANPEHAPYGQRAAEVLRRAGLWEAIRSHLVLGENAGQAARFAISGSAEGGLVAYSLVRAPAVASRSEIGLVPGAWHAPLTHRAVLLRRSSAAARRFFEFLATPRAGAVLRAHGFDLPEPAR